MPRMPSKNSLTSGLDRAAVFLSGLCLLHCLAVPFALLFGPVLGHWLSTTETQVHWWLLATALPVSVFALARGYQRYPSKLTLSLGAAGLVVMFVGVSHIFNEDWEVLLTAIGVSSLLAAHIRNLRSAHSHG